ncbi:3-polyprenyl-4-hydroxybenzoate carboxy-lyase UbiX [Chitinispirillum alkaliphilum]|nr:3-polyprenyl-4-hydroxybenzoate carboxy-lyase UbiX [Chitinispirillum alkaliphilum]
MKEKRIVVAITGASGVIYGVRVLEMLREAEAETHLIISEAASEVMSLETDYSVSDIKNMATFSYSESDFTASIASGSFRTDGMIVAPCSVKSLSAIANSFCSTLISRSADVTLKERRPLVLCVRETPFHKGHLDLMMRAADNGAVICPPIPSFYLHPRSLLDHIGQVAGKLISFVGIECKGLKGWTGKRDGFQGMVVKDTGGVCG